MEFPFYFFVSSDMSLQAYFIFSFLTSQKIPCRDPSTIEYKECALSLSGIIKNKNTKVLLHPPRYVTSRRHTMTSYDITMSSHVITSCNVMQLVRQVIKVNPCTKVPVLKVLTPNISWLL